MVWFGLVWFLLLWSDQARNEGLKKCKRINYHKVRQMATFKEQIKMGMFCKKKIGFLLRGLLSLFYLFSERKSVVTYPCMNYLSLMYRGHYVKHCLQPLLSNSCLQSKVVLTSLRDGNMIT